MRTTSFSPRIIIWQIKTTPDAGFADELDALKKAVPDDGTPVESRLDSQGHAFLVVERQQDGGLLTAHKEFDVQGRELSVVDQRQFALNVSRQPQDRVKSFLHVFDMAGAKLSVDGRDAGLRKSFVNVRGKDDPCLDGKGVTSRRLTTRCSARRKCSSKAAG